MVATSDNVSGGTPVATGYSDCLRRCLTCGLGFSNARSNPTLIYEDPVNNVPDQVRPGALQTLGAAINLCNRDNKSKKFGYSTSEDAVTWTVFSFLAREQPDVLLQLGRTLFGIHAAKEVTVLLWGVPITAGARGGSVQKDLRDVTAALHEDARRKTEPDVILDYGDAGVVFIEVKYRSGNGRTTKANWHRYLRQAGVFSDSAKAQASGLYELVRNWRVAHDLAAGRPFTVINLAPVATVDATESMSEFEDSLLVGPDRRFVALPWDSFLTELERAAGSLPPWLAIYLKERGLR